MRQTTRARNMLEQCSDVAIINVSKDMQVTVGALGLLRPRAEGKCRLRSDVAIVNVSMDMQLTVGAPRFVGQEDSRRKRQTLAETCAMVRECKDMQHKS